MIHLERSPRVGAEATRLIAESSVGLELPSGLFVPPRFDDHPALSLPYELASSEDEVLSGSGETPMWGGVYSEENFAQSSLYLSDNIPEEVRRHVAAILSLTMYGENMQLVRSVLLEAERTDPEMGRAIGRTLLSAARHFEPMYCSADSASKEQFRLETGMDISSHLLASRGQGGEIMFAADQIGQLHNLLNREGHIASGKLQTEIPFSAQKKVFTGNIGSPYGLGLSDKVLRAGIAREPDRPLKAHTCAGCHMHIAPKSLRVTVEVDALNQRFDHHHFHVGCVQ